MTTAVNDVQGSLTPASLLDRVGTYASDAARSVGRLVMRRTERTADVVNSEYNLSHWQKVLSDRDWTKTKDLTAFLAPSNPKQDLRKVDNLICRISAQDYRRLRIGALGALIGRHAGASKRIVELGTGYGHNLLSLHLSHPDWTFKGLDISTNGIAAAREIVSYFGLTDRISLDRIDLTDAADPSFSAIADEVVFTYFCIEQIPYDVKKVVENIIAGRPKRVINIEPTTELLDLTSLRDLVSFLYIRSVDYQTELFSTLDELEREGRIRILARERMPFAPSIHNDGFLYCWEPL
jgi:hypothetical protein